MPGQEEQVRTFTRRSNGIGIPLEPETVRFVLVSLLDIVMTYLVIHYSEQGHTSAMIGEGNPLPAFFIDRWGMPGMIAFKFLLVSFVIAMSQIVYRFSKLKARFMLNFGTVLVAVVVLYSLWLLLGAWSWDGV